MSCCSRLPMGRGDLAVWAAPVSGGGVLCISRVCRPSADLALKHALILRGGGAYQSLLRSTRHSTTSALPSVGGTLSRALRDRSPSCWRITIRRRCGAQAFPIGSWRASVPSSARRNLEAIGHLTRGLNVLETLPDTPERTQQELATDSSSDSRRLGRPRRWPPCRACEPGPRACRESESLLQLSGCARGVRQGFEDVSALG